MSRDLEEHGVRWRFNFLAVLPPTFDDEGNWFQYAKEPKWDEADLTTEHLAELDGWVADHLAARPQDGPDMARYATLEHNGVRHAHRRGKVLIPERPAYGYECRLCHGYIIDKDPGDSRFIGGPADGRWFVTNGASYWRVPVIEPVSLVEGDSFWEPMKVALYRRDGDLYCFEGVS